jgi:hypothetical protein
MRAPTIYRSSERGASQWPFIITLLLMLFFVWKWWETTELRDQALAEKATAIEQRQVDKSRAEKIIAYAEELSNSVGWKNSTIDTAGLDSKGRPSVPVTSLDVLKAHVQPGGVLPGEAGGKGTLADLEERATMAFTRAGRIHTSTTGPEKAMDYSVFPQAFKDKLQAYRDKWSDGIGSKPVPPTDEDDTRGMTEYRDALASYEQRAKERDEDFAELTADEAWKAFAEVVRMPSEWGPATGTEILVDYLPIAEGNAHTVEALLAPLPKMVDNYEQEITALQAAAVNTITQQAADVASRQTALDAAQAELTRVQAESTGQIEQLNRTLSEKTESITRLQDEASSARNELEQSKETFRGDLAKVSADRDAYQAGLANAKERRDVRIRRDDAKGTLLAVSDALGTGTVDLGTSDRAYVGMVFVVSSLDRGGNRVDKGRVVVTQVTGAHSSKVRVLEGRGQVAGGDRVHNALYNPTDPVHVYIHGTLDKWPKELAVARLKRLGVVVQDSVNGDTDYIVISNGLGVKPDTAGGGEDEGDEEGEAAANPLAQLEALARRAGAVIITERLFDTLLDY